MFPYFHMSNAYFYPIEALLWQGPQSDPRIDIWFWIQNIVKRLRDCGDNMLRDSDAVLRQACRLRVCQQMFDLKKAESRESESVIGSCPPASF